MRAGYACCCPAWKVVSCERQRLLPTTKDRPQQIDPNERRRPMSERNEMAIAMIEEQADSSIRRAWQNDRWYFSVIDVIGVMTDSGRPRKYWSDLKVSMQQKEGWSELSANIGQLRLPSRDGKN